MEDEETQNERLERERQEECRARHAFERECYHEAHMDAWQHLTGQETFTS